MADENRQRFINLDDLLPNRIVFRHRGHEYTMNGDPGFKDLLRLRQIEETINPGSKASPEEQEKAVNESLAIFAGLIVDRSDGAPTELDLNPRELAAIWHMLLDENSVGEALVAAMNDGAPLEPEQEDGSPLPEVRATSLPTKRSRKGSGSSARSSTSTRNGGTASNGRRSGSAAAASTSR